MNPAAVRSAAARIAGRVHRTPVLTSATLDDRTGARVLVKDEAVQKTGSFKARGALNRLLTLPDEARERGLVAVTARYAPGAEPAVSGVDLVIPRRGHTASETIVEETVEVIEDVRKDRL